MREIGRLILVLGIICALSGASLAYLRDNYALAASTTKWLDGKLG